LIRCSEGQKRCIRSRCREIIAWCRQLALTVRSGFVGRVASSLLNITVGSGLMSCADFGRRLVGYLRLGDPPFILDYRTACEFMLVGMAKRTPLAKLLEDEADLRRRQVFLTFPIKSFRIVGSRSLSRGRGIFALVDSRIKGYLFGRCRFQRSSSKLWPMEEK
jgi:hypothetical protein